MVKTLRSISASPTKPTKTGKRKVLKVTGRISKKSRRKAAGIALSIAAIPFAGAALGAARTAGAARITRGALSLAKFAAPKTLKSAIVASVVVPTAVGVFGSSKKARKAAFSIINPAENIKRGKKIAGFLEEHPEAADIAAKAGLLGLGAGAAAAAVLGGKKLLEKIKNGKKDPVPEQISGENLPAASAPAVAGQEAPIAAQTPKSPETQVLRAKARRKRKKAAPGAPRQTISQRVDVRIRACANKRFIKNVVLVPA